MIILNKDHILNIIKKKSENQLITFNKYKVLFIDDEIQVKWKHKSRPPFLSVSTSEK